MKEKGTFAERRMVRWAIVLALGWMFFGFVAGLTWPAKTWTSLIVLGAFVAAFLKFLDYASENLFHYVNGSKGEFKVWVILNELYGSGYRTVNNLELSDRGDIDHVVVGPTGVWAIESKFIDGEIGFSDGKLTRDGVEFKKDFLKQAHAEAFAVRDFLMSKGFDVPVKPVLVFSRQHAKVRFGESKISGVYVIGSMYLRKIISGKSQGNALNKEQVNKIFDVLESASNS